MEQIKIHSKRRDYPVILGDNLIEIMKSELDRDTRYFVVLDDKIPSKYPKFIKDLNPNSIIHVLKGSEDVKEFNVYETVTSTLLEYNFSKKDKLIAFGGGTILDLVGYVSATYKRGIEFISIPTTTLIKILITQVSNIQEDTIIKDLYNWRSLLTFKITLRISL